MRLFNFGYKNHLCFSGIVNTKNYTSICGYWLSGRIFGYYISIYFPLPWKNQE